jgi:hypothetical protein
MDTALNRRAYSRVGFALFLQILLVTLLQLGAQTVVSRMGYETETGSWVYYMVALLPQYLIAMPVSAAIITRIPVLLTIRTSMPWPLLREAFRSASATPTLN